MKDISLHLMDIAQNSVTAGANRIVIGFDAQDEPGRLIFEVKDDGRGMDPEFLKKVTDPFMTSRTTREVGLGIPLLKQSAEMAGGGLDLESQPFKGTKLKAVFDIYNIDRIPLGDIPGTLKMLIMGNPNISWKLRLSARNNDFVLDTEEIRQHLDGIPLDNADVLNWIQNTIHEGIKVVFGGVLDEVN